MAFTSESEVSSNGEELLCNYEKERLENIKHNEKMLKILGEFYHIQCLVQVANLFPFVHSNSGK